MTDVTRRAAHDLPTAAVAGPAALPVQLSSFVGREREVAAVRALVGQARLVTLTGAGGSGKTRLALEAAAQAGREIGLPVCWVELAGLSDPALVPQHVAEQLGIQQEGMHSAAQTLVEHLRDQSVLLLLDNCEHLVDACARLVETLLRGCPRLQILATSREALAIDGERAWLVPPLSLPAADPEPEADLAAASDAVRLFVERAQEVLPSFALSPANARGVAEICQRLDGLPLAIELAAARVRVLTPEQILQHLHDSFRLLTAGRRTALPRQQTLRATIEWSVALLTPEEQQLLERLSVFRGGFTLEAVEAVCADEAIPPFQLLDLLARLVDRSLVAMREVETSARYFLLETVRQFAAEQLRAHGADGRFRREHARFYSGLVAAAEPHLITPRRPHWLGRLQQDLENVREALSWTREEDPELHLRLTGMLCWFWFSTGFWSEGRRWAEEALALPVAAAPTRARAATLFAAAVIAALQAQTRLAQAWLEECVAIARAAGDGRLEAYAQNYLGMALVQQGRPEGAIPTREALEWFRANDDPYGLRLSLLLLGNLAAALGDVDGARGLGEEAVGVARSFGLPRELGIALQMHGSWLMQGGDLERARTLFRESLLALREDPQHLFLARGLEMLGAVASEQGDAPAAIRLWGAGESVRERIGAGTFQTDRAHLQPRIDRIRRQVGEDALALHWAEGKRMTLAEALQYAIGWGAPGAPAAAPASPEPLPQAAPPTLEVRALGPLEVASHGVRAAPELSTGRPLELLLYLLCHPGGRTREQVGVALWPDASPTQAKNSFHVLLHRLRSTVGLPDLVVRDRERYRLNPDVGVWFDAAVFAEGVDDALDALRRGEEVAGRIQTLLPLYRGDFLDDAAVGGWHLEFRDGLRRRYGEALAALAELQVRQEAHQDAISTLERLVRQEDLLEEAHRQLMHCYAQTRQPDRALQHYDRLVALLRAEVDTEPEPATTALADRIRSSMASQDGRSPVS